MSENEKITMSVFATPVLKVREPEDIETIDDIFVDIRKRLDRLERTVFRQIGETEETQEYVGP